MARKTDNTDPETSKAAAEAEVAVAPVEESNVVDIKTKKVPAAPRERKYNDEIVKRAISLRKTKGYGFLRVARAIGEEFSIDVSPAALRAATLRYKGIESLNDLPKKERVHRNVEAASSRIDGSDEHDAAVKSGQ